MGTYKAKERRKYATVGDDSYPIGDKKHARLALDFIDEGSLDSSEKAAVRRKAAKFGVRTATKKKKVERKMKHIHD